MMEILTPTGRRDMCLNCNRPVIEMIGGSRRSWSHETAIDGRPDLCQPFTVAVPTSGPTPCPTCGATSTDILGCHCRYHSGVHRYCDQNCMSGGGCVPDCAP